MVRREDCVVTAIADIDPEMVRRTKAIFEKQNKPLPTFYTNGPEDFRNLLEKEDLDAVIIASPWRWHTPMAVAAMQAGLYVGTEVCGAFSIDECWELVRTHEATGSHLFFLENVCYRRDVMAVLNMVRQGMFGELLHLEGGYQHDLRAVKFNDGKQPYGGGVEFGAKAFHEARWRTGHSVHRNGDLYPTHGVGPVANYININRGNRFVGLTSMASKSRSLHEYIVNHPKGGPSHPNAKVEFKLGDKVTTMLSTANGETVVLHHDTNLPRPYSLGFRVQGTKGLWMDVNKSLHIEGVSEAHRWETTERYFEKYDHPLWEKMADRAVGAGHGGMDFFLVNAFIEAAKANATAPIDVYDAATWLAITPLSEQSVAQGGTLQTFPDFTNGKWMDRKVDFAMGEY
jgi:predicted dehydrogenase